MSFKPNLTNVILEPCCQRSIDDINRILRSGKWLQKIILPGAFALLFVSPSDRLSRGAGITTIASITQTDWNLLVQATMAVPVFIRKQCWTVCFLEVLNHQGNLKKFWKSIADAFL